MAVAIKIESLSKQYRLGLVSTRTLSHDLNRWWQRVILRNDDPYLKVTEINDKTNKSGSEYIWALKDISLEVREGEVMGIIGKNGAGKSTLLKILSRVTTPTLGVVKARGRIASLLEVGTGFHQEMTGRENIFMNGAIIGMTKSEIRMKFDEIVDFSGVERYIDTPVKRYSTGMVVRLGFSVAAFMEPEILVVDEVLAVGDAEFQKKAVGKMKTVSDSEGRTVLFVSHNMVAIQNLCESSIVMEKGNIVYEGNVNDALNYYLSPMNSPIVDIDQRTDRIGNQIAKVTNIMILNSKGTETNQISLGEGFEVILEIKGRLKNAIIGVLIGNQSIGQICRGYSYESYPDSIDINGYLMVKCFFENVPLVQGTYYIHTWVGLYKDVVDYVENAMELVIQESDIFNTGKIMDPKVPCFANHRWELIS